MTPRDAFVRQITGQPLDRIQSAREQELRKRSELATARQGLRDALEAGQDAGMSLQELGELLGVSRQRVDQLLKEER